MALQCDEIQDDWHLYAMGTLEAFRTRQIDLHLAAGCERCQAEYDRARQAVMPLALVVPQRVPSADVEEKLRARITGGAAVEQRRPEAGASRRWTVWTPWMVAAASVVTAVWFGREAADWKAKWETLSREPAKVAVVAPQPVTPPPATAPILPAPAPVVLKVWDESAVAEVRKELSGEIERLRQALDAAVSERDRMVAESSRLRAAAQESASRIGTLETALAAERRKESSPLRAVATPPPAPIPSPATSASTEELARLRGETERLTRQVADYRSLFRVLDAADLRQVELRKSDAIAGGASARALWSPTTGLVLLARDLPVLPEGKCYQLWAVRRTDNAIISAGILQTDGRGRGLLLAGPAGLSGLSAFSVTDEPAGGSKLARGHKLLFGAL